MQVKRAELLAALAIVRPALVGRPYIQSLSHVLLDKGWLTAFNETIAITTWLDADVATLGACVPGEQLIAALGQFSAQAVEVTHASGSLTVSSGKARVNLGTLPASDFLYEAPDWQDGQFDLTPDVIEGIACCLLAVGKDEAMPATLGVTATLEDGLVVLYSTDNRTITRFEAGGDCHLGVEALRVNPVGVLLPTAFCEQLVSLAKQFPDRPPCMLLTPSHAMADFDGKAILTTRLPADFEPINFTEKFDGLVSLDRLNEAMPIPDGFDGAMARASLVLGAARDPSVRVTLGGGVMDLDATAAAGSSHDTLAFGSASDPRFAFSVDPALVMRAAKSCVDILPLERVLVMCGRKGALTHLVSHVSR